MTHDYIPMPSSSFSVSYDDWASFEKSNILFVIVSVVLIEIKSVNVAFPIAT